MWVKPRKKRRATDGWRMIPTRHWVVLPGTWWFYPLRARFLEEGLATSPPQNQRLYDTNFIFVFNFIFIYFVPSLSARPGHTVFVEPQCWFFWVFVFGFFNRILSLTRSRCPIKHPSSSLSSPLGFYLLTAGRQRRRYRVTWMKLVERAETREPEPARTHVLLLSRSL